MAFINFDFVKQPHLCGGATHGWFATRLNIKAKLVRDHLIVFGLFSRHRLTTPALPSMRKTLPK
jgi:hypothetical protein